jgi:acyl-homoserine-lactone acylase
MASSLVTPDPYLEPRGSNGIAVAPSRTASGNAMLLINPHTSFYFREEAHVVSEEGLNAYGALTWGQFFVYQGFNEDAGWMHTSSSVDNIDEFAEVIVEQEDGLYYRYGEELRPVEEKEVTIRYRTDDGGMGERTFTTYRTHHGPIVRADDGRWVAVALMEEPMQALIQSYSRTRATNLDEYLEVMEAHTNSSNNTLFADSEGNVAYLHSNFVPERDDRFDYDRPVDGSDPATDWNGVHDIDESPNSINPGSGWAYCTNNWPYSASGEGFSPSPTDFPRYMDRGSENPRGEHAIMLLEEAEGLTLEGLRDLAYDSYLTAFDDLVPALVADFDALPAADPRRSELGEAVGLLEEWDLRWGVESVPTAVAVFWITELREMTGDASRAAGMDSYAYMESRAARTARLDALGAALDRLEEDFGDWRTPWGEINRFQRLSGDIDLQYDDEQPSVPVGFTSARWGSLASFGAGPREGTKRWYGSSGNSFVAVVEFGERVRAMAVTAGGLSNQPDSPHFDDQIERYATGDLRPVNFYREDVEANAERRYRPGR